jgi:hypothetical protein
MARAPLWRCRGVHLAQKHHGHDVTLIDMWPENIER